MKPLAGLLLIAALSTTAQAAGEKPALPIEKALAIAQGYLKNSGHAGDVAIASLSVGRASLTGKRVHWSATWAPAITLDDGRKELGLEINMDGSIVRLVDKKARK